MPGVAGLFSVAGLALAWRTEALSPALANLLNLPMVLTSWP